MTMSLELMAKSHCLLSEQPQMCMLLICKNILFKYLSMKLIILFGKHLCGEPNPFCVYKVVEFPAKGTRTSIMNGITLWCPIPVPSANLFWKVFPAPHSY